MRFLSTVVAVSLMGACATSSSNQVQSEPHAPLAAATNVAHHAEHHDTAGEHGKIDFPVSCNERAATSIETGLGHLHHMMYEQARSHFETALEADSQCAMAYWGVAMTSFQPLWHPTSDQDLARGKAALERAQTLGAPTPREDGYITAAKAFFAEPEPAQPERPADHLARVRAWEEAQRQLHEAYPEDVDAAAFYALAQVASVPPLAEDQTYEKQRQAGQLIERYLADYPEHPGLFHYLIHAYDNPVLASKAEPIARAYDQLAPDVPHALHMPSHIYVRLGEWEDAASWNERSAAAALRQPVDGVTSLHYPHALDYAMYAYLQQGNQEEAANTLQRVEAIEDVQPQFASAYGIAAPRARYYLEQELWEQAATLEPRTPAALPWDEFPAAEALIYYARGLGAARSGDVKGANVQLTRLQEIVGALEKAGDDYWAAQTRVLHKTVAAWVAQERGHRKAALSRMAQAADLEDSMEKHPITPGPIRPARELYGEMLLLAGHADRALEAFELTLKNQPNRRRARQGAERARRFDRQK